MSAAIISRVFAWLAGHRRLTIRIVLVGLGLALTLLSGAVGPSQRRAADPVYRLARISGGDLTPVGLNRVSLGMSPYASRTAERLTTGGAAWSPGGSLGWPDYNLARVPELVRRDLTFDEARDFNALLPVSDTPLGVMKPFVLPANAAADKARAEHCLTQAVYFEAGFESGEGQQAVAQVVLNRLRHPAYPKSVCGVVYQGSQRSTGCQFSFTCDGSLERIPAAAAWANAQYVAKRALAGFVYKPVGTATHYHADYVFPYWAVTLVKLRQIGAHIFYRMTGPIGSPDAFNGRYAGNETALSADILTGGDTRTPNASAVRPPDATPEVVTPPPRTVSLTIGGETRTYVVGPAGSLSQAATPAPVPQTPPAGQAAAPAATAIPPVPANMPALNIPTVVPGSLMPSRRRPTSAEVADINEKLRQREEEMKAVGPTIKGP